MAIGWGWSLALTAVFVAAAMMYAFRVPAAQGWPRKSAWIVHVVAAAVMVIMIWPIGMAISPLFYLLFFTAAALAAVYLGLFLSAVGNWAYHAAMLGAMAVMPAAMTSPAAASTTPAMGGQSHHMDMGSASVAAGQDPVWLQASAATLAVLLSASALWWLYALVRGPQRPWADVLMAGGMAVCFALLSVTHP